MFHLTMLIKVVAICTKIFNITTLLTLPVQCIYGFCGSYNK